LSWGYYEIIELGKGVESMSDIIKEQCKRIRTIFATAKLKSKVYTEKQKMPLVQMSHYEKE
jgi:predicted CopG family antitoxin